MLEGSFFYDKNFLKIPEVTNKQSNRNRCPIWTKSYNGDYYSLIGLLIIKK